MTITAWCRERTNARTRIGRTTLEFFQWLLIAVGYWGCISLWSGFIAAALAAKMPDGVISWMNGGIVLLFFQLRYAITLVATSRGVERYRRAAMLGAISLNFLGNSFTIIVIWTQVGIGRMVLSRQDMIGLVTVGLLMVGILLWMKYTKGPIAIPFFWLAVCTRFLPQVEVAVSTVVVMLPVSGIIGLVTIAVQRVSMMTLEFFKAQHRQLHDPDNPNAQQAYQAARWTYRGDWCNLAAALFVATSYTLRGV